jgi:hypothetical protein
VSYWYISFSSEDEFLGATVVQAANAEAALLEASARNLNPGGQAAIAEVPTEAESDPDMLATINRLLSRDELMAQGAGRHGDLGDEQESFVAAATTVRQVRCATHGVQPQTMVCQHIVEGLVNHKRVGFFWNASDTENPRGDAWCLECDSRVALTGGEWVGPALEHLQPKVLCGECYDFAKAFNMGADSN